MKLRNFDDISHDSESYYKSWIDSPRERFRIDLIVLCDRSRLNHPGELRLLNKDQALLHVFLAPLHSASSSTSLLVDRPIVRPLRLRAFRWRRLQTTTLRSGRRFPDGWHRGRLMIRLVDHGSWIAGLVLKTRASGDFNAWRTRGSPDLSSFS